jgi:hypothetical protein
MHRGMRDLPMLGEECHAKLAELCADTDPSDVDAGLAPPDPAETGTGPAKRRERIIEEISALLIVELSWHGLSDSDSDFLLDHAHAVQARIEDDGLRSAHVMLE